jgi:ribosomal protein S18 acetylase RimI-like enzyme
MKFYIIRAGGTHPTFQRKGLDKAITSEVLHRLTEPGKERAIICAGEENSATIWLYESSRSNITDRFGFFKKKI